jgi:hypothetical protein
VVDPAARHQDGLVVEPVTVWMVHLGLGGGTKPLEVRGTLSLEEEGLTFVERKSGADVRFEYASIRRAKRLRGSPVLLVDWRRGDEPRKTAFYFSQPPPLEPVPRSATIEPRGPLGPFTRATPSKRQVARMNLGYLRSTSVTNRKVLKAWAQAVSERVGRAR